MTSLKVLEQQLQLLDAAERSLDAEIGRILPVLEEHPIRSYKPLGLPAELGGDPRAAKGVAYAFHCSPAIHRLNIGQNRSGRTYADAADLVMHLTGEYPEWYPRECRIWDGEKRHRPFKARVLAPTFNKGIMDVVWPAIESLLPKSMRVTPKRNSSGDLTAASFPNGAEISFMAYVQGPKRAAGWHGHFAMFDEPPEDREIYIETVRGLLDWNGRDVLGFTNVGPGIPWVDKMFMRLHRAKAEERQLFGVNSMSWPGPLSSKRAYFNFPLEANPNIPEERKSEWLEEFLDPELDAARISGLPMGLEYAVFKNFDERVHSVAPISVPKDEKTGRPKDVTLYMGMDPHDARPSFILWLAVFKPDDIGVSKKRVYMESFDKSTRNIEEEAGLVKALETNFGLPRRRVIDPNFGPKTYRNTGRTVMQEWAIAGRKINWPIYFTPGNDNVELGHDAIRKALANRCLDGSAELAVCETCPRLLDALRYYAVNPKTGNVDAHNPYKHAIDTLRYVMMLKPRYIDPAEDEGVADTEPYVPDEVTGY